MRKHKLIIARRLGIFACIFGLVCSPGGIIKPKLKPFTQSNYNIETDINIIKTLRKLYINKEEINENPEKSTTDKTDISKGAIFKVSAYDLSYQSCQKSRGNEKYGITASGFDLRGHTLTSARVVAIDPRIIPMGSKIRLTFTDDKYKKYNGIYFALDKGGGIIGRQLDLFIGDSFNSKKVAKNFGVTNCKVEIIKEK